MNRDSSLPQSGQIGEPWQELDEVVEAVARLSGSEISAPEFHAELLDRIVPALGAVGGALWTRRADAGLRLDYQVNLEGAGLTGSAEAQRSHARLVERVLQTGQPKAVPPRSGRADADQGANPSEFVLLSCPWKFEDEWAGVVELIQRPGLGPAAERGYLNFLTAICELVADFHRNHQLRASKERMDLLGQFEQFTQRIHASLDLKTTAYRIANEGRRLIGCDRVSVAVGAGVKCRVLAVSGADNVHRRASGRRELEKLSAAVAAVGEPLWHPDHAVSPAAGDAVPPAAGDAVPPAADDAELPDAIDRPLTAYLDISHARGLGVLPLEVREEERGERRPELIGVVIVEQFQGEFDERMRVRVSAVLGHCALALRNALQMHRVPLRRPARAIGSLMQARQLPKTGLALLAVVAAAIALVVVRVDFPVKARGELQPAVRHDVFAPGDGVVSAVRVGHGQRVDARQVLVEMRRPELDFDFQRVWGELQTARTRLASVEAERLQNPRVTAEQRQRHNRLTAEKEELNEQIGGLQKQYEILRQEQAELKVRSPIDAAVLTWDLKELLDARPVGRGQVLMTVADLDGPWVLELRVPDDRIAHLLAAREKPGDGPHVSFVLATAPGVELHGKVEQLGVRTEIGESGEAFVPVTVRVDRDQLPTLVPGATVVAKIDCGRRSLGYVWLHDLIDAVRLWILF